MPVIFISVELVNCWRGEHLTALYAVSDRLPGGVTAGIESPAMHPTRCRFEPSVGVLLTALNNAGVTIDEALLEQRLVPTIPEQTFFTTIIERAVL